MSDFSYSGKPPVPKIELKPKPTVDKIKRIIEITQKVFFEDELKNKFKGPVFDVHAVEINMKHAQMLFKELGYELTPNNIDRLRHGIVAINGVPIILVDHVKDVSVLIVEKNQT